MNFISHPALSLDLDGLKYSWEDPKQDQNPKFTPQSETMSIHICLIWECPPPPPGTAILVMYYSTASLSYK